MKVTCGIHMGHEPASCLECGNRVEGSPVFTLYANNPGGAPNTFHSLGQFCEECAGRFGEIGEPSGPFAFETRVDYEKLRGAVRRSAKRLRAQARELEKAEIVTDLEE